MASKDTIYTLLFGGEVVFTPHDACRCLCDSAPLVTPRKVGNHHKYDTIHTYCFEQIGRRLFSFCVTRVS